MTKTLCLIKTKTDLIDWIKTRTIILIHSEVKKSITENKIIFIRISSLHLWKKHIYFYLFLWFVNVWFLIYNFFIFIPIWLLFLLVWGKGGRRGLTTYHMSKKIRLAILTENKKTSLIVEINRSIFEQFYRFIVKSNY